jgi:hypothetical protein
MNELIDTDDLDQIEDQEDEAEQDHNHEELTEAQFSKLMEHWKQEAGLGGGQGMMDEWAKVWEEEAAMGMMGAP